jgi:hypothetical protein
MRTPQSPDLVSPPPPFSKRSGSTPAGPWEEGPPRATYTRGMALIERLHNPMGLTAAARLSAFASEAL